MRNKYLLVLLAVLGAFSACGDNIGVGGKNLSLSSITGDGPSGRIKTGIIIKGKNFQENASVSLFTRSGEKVADLLVASASAEEITAQLPQNTLPGDYAIKLVSGGAEVSTSVTILKGEKGDSGIQGSKGNVGLSGDSGLAGAVGSVGLTGAVGAVGPQGTVGMSGAQGLRGLTGLIGPIGPQGPEGSYHSEEGVITFSFTTRPAANLEGTWRPFVIGPDQTHYYGPSIDIRADSVTADIIVGSPVLIGPYTIVLYNESIAGAHNSFVTGSIMVTDSFNSEHKTRYNYFTVLPDPGYNQQLLYTPFVSLKP